MRHTNNKMQSDLQTPHSLFQCAESIPTSIAPWAEKKKKNPCREVKVRCLMALSVSLAYTHSGRARGGWCCMPPVTWHLQIHCPESFQQRKSSSHSVTLSNIFLISPNWSLDIVCHWSALCVCQFHLLCSLTSNLTISSLTMAWFKCQHLCSISATQCTGQLYAYCLKCVNTILSHNIANYNNKYNRLHYIHFKK